MNINNSNLSISTGVIIALVLYILYLTQCKKGDPCPDGARIRTDTVSRTIIVHDTSKPKVITIYSPGDTVWRSKPGPTVFLTDTIEVVRFPTTIDTQAVIKDYYSKIIQQGKLKWDGPKGERIDVTTTDTLYQNRITGRLWHVDYTGPSQKLKSQFYFGGGFSTSLFLNKGINTQAISAAHIDLGYINKKGQHLKVDLMRSAGQWHEGLSFYHTFGK